MGYLSQLYGPLETISKRIVTLQSALASAERAYTVLDEPHDVAEKTNARPLGRANGALSFRNVSFAYQEGQPVLQDISFDVPAGTRVGIAGRTGAGKTTLANLLTRFYDPTSGAIFLDGVDLRDYKIADLRNQFAIVLQEPVLFSYAHGLAGVPGIRLITYDATEKSNYQYIVTEVDKALAGLSRDQLVTVLVAENVIARRYFYPGCHRMEPYRSYYPHAGLVLPVTERIAQRVMLLPTGTAVGAKEIAHICHIIRFAVENGAALKQMLEQDGPRRAQVHAEARMAAEAKT